ncbi:RHS repeat protein [Ulvibacterium marinum]|uniref:RHS repeat protein n=1 Tax=Ulvibacterium marinum TaxID=2419782 RepID=A0A3B0BTZ5_9FLAO|nr:RHS repeat domain-containing protein [Ulvibacterium marinum]RKN75921.1 hypothetical protein D7Z94_24990 [Ulvibacterium marinum]
MKSIPLFAALMLCALWSNAQVDLKQVVPPNPNVASLFKSVITPVTEYSGLPNVSIPLYTVNEGGISVPLSLSYATGGIQVSEESGIVGLGWALNAGGAITRSVNGMDDFEPLFGYLNHAKVHPDLPPERDPITNAWNPDTHAFVDALNPANSMEEICRFIVNQQTSQEATYNIPPAPGSGTDDFDFMPDMFHFNFNGYSGSFVFNKQGDVVLLNKKGLDVFTTLDMGLVNFNIITEDGTLYEFTERATTSFLAGPSPKTYISTWFLKKITDIYGNTAEFSYDTTEKTKPFPSFTQSYLATTGGTTNPTKNYESYSGPITETDNFYLDSITAKKADGQSTQTTALNYSSLIDRKDLNGRYLESIITTNAVGDTVNKHNFNYSYFGSEKTYQYQNISLQNGDFGQRIGALNGDYPDLNLRLKLDSVIENDISQHSFEYFQPNFIPNKTTMGQDYWGFYNGSFNSDIFIPYIYSHLTQYSTFVQDKKANRLPSEEHTKTFSLKKITYPTKGSTEFDYELNTYADTGNFNEAPTPTIPVSQRAAVVSTPESTDDTVRITIKPNQFGVLKLTYNVTVTGWNASGAYSNSKPPAPDFQNDFYVEIKKLDGTLIRPRFHISTGNTEWDNLTVEQNSGYGAVINYSDTEEWYYDVNAGNFQLTDQEYVIEAHFNSSNGLYYGMADIHAQWEDIEISVDKQYSIGGGLRVKSITDFDSSGTEEIKRMYNYHYTTLENNLEVERSYGKIKTLPNFAIDETAVRGYSSVDPNGFFYGTTGFQPRVLGTASSHNAFSKDAGGYVGYDKVEITTIGAGGNNGKTIKTFHNQQDHFRSVTQPAYEDSYHKFPPIRVPHNGLLISEKNYKRVGGTYSLVSEMANTYEINGITSGQFNLFRLYENQDRVISASKELPISDITQDGLVYRYCDAMKFQLYPHYSNLIQQTGTKETIYNSEGIDSLVTLQEFKYENPLHLQRTESKLINSKGEEVITKTFYPDDVTTLSSLGSPDLSAPEKALIDRLKRDSLLHRIAEPVQTETTINGERTVQRTIYKDWDTAPGPNSYKVWPELVQTLKGNYHLTNNPMETRLNYLSYDDLGNPLEVSKQDGTTITYIWGYDGKYPVAKIEHATHTQALATTVNFNVIDNPATTDIAMRTELQKLRSELPQAMVTTYTYNPLVGVTSVTDPRGYTMTYTYDTANRLVEVRDADGHLVTDYEYHYKGQSN